MYSKNITSSEPTLILVLIDQSGSMRGHWGNSGISKCVLAANAVNHTLYDLTLNACMKDGELIDRVHVGVFGYGHGGVSWRLPGSRGSGWQTASSWCTGFSSTERVPVSHDGNKAIEQEIPIWLEPVAANGTPMAQALQNAHQVVKAHAAAYPNSHPPIVINITDGEAGGIESPSNQIQSVITEDGNALLFNLQIASEGGTPVMFPEHPPSGCTPYTQVLHSVSSIVPANMALRAARLGIAIPESGRAIVLNADPLSLTRLLQVGTTLVNVPDSDVVQLQLTEGQLDEESTIHA